MTSRNLIILGSTGSIGRSTLDIVDSFPGQFTVLGLAAFSNAELLAEQCRKYQPKSICLVSETSVNKLRQLLPNQNVEILSGESGLAELTKLPDADLVLNGIVGAAGLRASLETVRQGRLLALANKESLVAGGPLFTQYLNSEKQIILPIDSEHSAIWQLLKFGRPDALKQIILTSSGGPFRNLPQEELEYVSVEDALCHPTWQMGPKITIDSATLVNKGLEVIEASYLFNVPANKIRVLIHPQSIVHSMVELHDSSVFAQMSRPDMRLPISHALFWPERPVANWGALNWDKLASLSFEPPDFNKFPALPLAYAALETGGTATAVYNAANETAVAAFMEKSIKFTEIAETIQRTLEKVEIHHKPDLETILNADRQAREIARQAVEKVTW